MSEGVHMCIALTSDGRTGISDPVTLAEAARRLGLLSATLRASIKGGILPASEPHPGEYHIAEEDLRRFASAVGRPLDPIT
jgi:hypothetical protein